MADQEVTPPRPSWLARQRLHVGALIMGGEMAGIVARLWLIRQLARAAVAPTGHVVLAECEALAEVLYEEMPESYTFTIQRNPERFNG